MAAITQEEYRDLERGLMERTLERASSDPEWRQRLLDDPGAAQTEAGFPEAQRLREMREKMTAVPDSEVQGHDQLWEFTTCYHFTAYVGVEYVLFDT